MKKEAKKQFYTAFCLLTAFVLWTVLLRLVDTRPVGPQGSTVGFATVNQAIHDFIGLHLFLYTVTDWLGLIPIFVALGFAVLGLIQWFKRKSLLKVDFDILVLGGFYVAVMAVFLFFELAVINYRPIMIEGCLEASYPSSTTMLAMCVMSTAMMQLDSRMKNGWLKHIILLSMRAFTAFMVIGRLLSGVHWFTDIVGGTLISAGLVTLYRALIFWWELRALGCEC